MSFDGLSSLAKSCRAASRLAIVASCLISLAGVHLQSQITALPPATAIVGDTPDSPGPLATDISSAIDKAAIKAVIRRVADWQLQVAEPRFNRLWTYAALYDGLIVASKATGDPKYAAAVRRFAEEQHWQLIDDRFPHADDMAMGKAYMSLYLGDAKTLRKPGHIADTKRNLDRLLERADDPAKLLWWWCDALYMAPPVLAQLAEATGDRKYVDYMDHEWWMTSAQLYNQTDHLFSRDERYLTRKEANGKNLYWSRGNGWVMGGLVKLLETLPKDYPTRPKYVEQFKQMAEEVMLIQGNDGLWHSGLLDPEAYDNPEISGSAFFNYAIAYGINEHILNRDKFYPVVAMSWAGMLKHIYADGRLGSIQPIDAQPGNFKASASYVYGIGGFLEAAYEMNRLAEHRNPRKGKVVSTTPY